jgi:hypothetical protein
MGFQGLSTGDVNRDAQPLRFMIHEGVPVVLIQGFDAVSGRLFSLIPDDGPLCRLARYRLSGYSNH